MQGDEFLERMRRNKKDPVLWRAVDQMTSNAAKSAIKLFKISLDEAEDIAQETNTKVFKKWATYKNKGSLQAWINAIYKTTGLDYLDKKDNREYKKGQRLDAPLKSNQDDDAGNITTMFDITTSTQTYELDDYLAKQQAYAALEERARNSKAWHKAIALICWVVENNAPSVKAMANHFGCSESAASTRKSDAFKKVQSLFEDFCDCDLSGLSKVGNKNGK